MGTQPGWRVAVVATLLALLFAARFAVSDPAELGVGFLLVVPVVLAAAWFGERGAVLAAVAGAATFALGEVLRDAGFGADVLVPATLLRLAGLLVAGVLVARLIAARVPRPHPRQDDARGGLHRPSPAPHGGGVAKRPQLATTAMTTMSATPASRHASTIAGRMPSRSGCRTSAWSSTSRAAS